MITEHILFYPHKEYNLKKELTDNLRCSDYIQYGYIKKRDLSKWENNEVVSVKMGMLTPSKDGYKHKTILQSAIQRINEQDSTSCFDEDDELIPIYIFVSKETDVEWREYLKTQGFVSSRPNKNREGMRICKSDIGLHYGLHYGIDTIEILSIKEYVEKQRIEKEEKEKQRIEKIILDYEQTQQRSYKDDMLTQKERIKDITNNIRYVDVFLDELTLNIRAFKCSFFYEYKESIIGFILSLCIILGIICGGILFTIPHLLFNENSDFTLLGLISIILLSLSIIVFGYIIFGGEITLPMGKWVSFDINGVEKEIEYDTKPSINNEYVHRIGDFD